MWPSSAAATPAPVSSEVRGYHIFRWSRDGLMFWAISDLNANELRTFVELEQK